MTTAHAYTLLLEAAALAASFGMLWLAFWIRDRPRHIQQVRRARPSRAPVSDFASPQQDFAMVDRRLTLASVASGFRLTINVDSSNVQPASEKDKAILHGPEHAQHFDDKPQIQAEQH
jgi:hypothetical protein